jgi:hypothetical protein
MRSSADTSTFVLSNGVGAKINFKAGYRVIPPAGGAV